MNNVTSDFCNYQYSFNTVNFDNCKVPIYRHNVTNN